MTAVEARPVELWDIDKIVPYEKNAKKHSDEQVEKIATAIKEFGWTQPMVIDKDGIVIIGHGRRLAAIKLGLKKVPVDVRRDLTPAQANALRLSDNRVTSTEYDMDLIQAELLDLDGEGYDLTVIGFDDRELEFVTADLGDMDGDFFVDDVNAAVEEQREANQRAEEEVDDIAAPVADALGFKRVTIAQSRTIRDFMTRIEARTGKTGVDALIDHIAAVE